MKDRSTEMAEVHAEPKMRDCWPQSLEEFQRTVTPVTVRDEGPDAITLADADHCCCQLLLTTEDYATC
jgi:hypothetical protein